MQQHMLLCLALAVLGAAAVVPNARGAAGVCTADEPNCTDPTSAAEQAALGDELLRASDYDGALEAFINARALDADVEVNAGGASVDHLIARMQVMAGRHADALRSCLGILNSAAGWEDPQSWRTYSETVFRISSAGTGKIGEAMSQFNPDTMEMVMLEAFRRTSEPKSEMLIAQAAIAMFVEDEFIHGELLKPVQGGGDTAQLDSLIDDQALFRILMADTVTLTALDSPLLHNTELDALLAYVRARVLKQQHGLLTTAAAGDEAATGNGQRLGQGAIAILSAMGRHCHNAKYIMPASAEERALLGAVRAAAAEDVANVGRWALLSTYEPLWTVPHAEKLLEAGVVDGWQVGDDAREQFQRTVDQQVAPAVSELAAHGGGPSSLSGARRLKLHAFGERNSGVTFFSNLVEKNVPRAHLRPASPRLWQHARVSARELTAENFGEDFDDDTVFVLVAKDPYAWVVSMFDSPPLESTAGEEAAADLDTFARAMWREQHQHLGRDHVDFQSGVTALRTSKLRNALSVADLVSKFHVVRYEDLLLRPEETLKALCDKFGIPFDASQFVANDVLTRTGNAQSKRFYKHDYYADAEYMAQYSDDTFCWVSAGLDAELERSVGYDVPQATRASTTTCVGTRAATSY